MICGCRNEAVARAGGARIDERTSQDVFVREGLPKGERWPTLAFGDDFSRANHPVSHRRCS